MDGTALLLDAVANPVGVDADSSGESGPTSDGEAGTTGGAWVEGSVSIASLSSCAVASAGCSETVDIKRSDNASVVMSL